MKRLAGSLAVASLLLVLAAIGVFVVQIWTTIFDADTFLKIEVTLGAVATAVFVTWYFLKESADSEEMRKGKLD